MGEPAEKPMWAMSEAQFLAAVRRAVDEAFEAREARAAEAQQDEVPTKEAAKSLGMSSAALRHHIARGNIVPDTRARKGGVKSSRFKRSTIEAFRRRTRGDTEE